MAGPPNLEEGQSTTRPPRFNGKYYGWWKTRMHDFIMAEDSELWDGIFNGLFVPMKAVGKGTNDYNCVSAYESAKEIWEAFKTAQEGTIMVNQSKIDMLTTEYEVFKIFEDEFHSGYAHRLHLHYY
uniref:Uncharacterized protein LOC104246537 n=1 Tax=Nicotiana sylvestris TaxID=4096 RepID=A0A1U7YFB4_NICSY|nr:PREDICTED: uncharacterized protein LOC104246537 [Nicotiana sylvestris]